jgi:hypothetical protein
MQIYFLLVLPVCLTSEIESVFRKVKLGKIEFSWVKTMIKQKSFT